MSGHPDAGYAMDARERAAWRALDAQFVADAAAVDAAEAAMSPEELDAAAEAYLDEVIALADLYAAGDQPVEPLAPPLPLTDVRPVSWWRRAALCALDAVLAGPAMLRSLRPWHDPYGVAGVQ